MNALFRPYSGSVVVSQPKMYFPALKGPIFYAFLLFFHIIIIFHYIALFFVLVLVLYFITIDYPQPL